MKVFAKLFENMGSVEYLDISSNVKCDVHPALKVLLQGLVKCKTKIRHLDISNNKSVNCPGTLQALQDFMHTNLTLNSLNISELGMNKENGVFLLEDLTHHFRCNWNLNNNLKRLYWDKDMSHSKVELKKFLVEVVAKIHNRKL